VRSDVHRAASDKIWAQLSFPASRAVGIINKTLAILLLIALAAPALAFDVRPNPNLTGGSVRADGHDAHSACGRSKAHRGPMTHARRDEILM
jgi:hypothetical protein